ncbi:uncharacterized protein C12orf40 homolog isoform X3 [Podarcis raffonei]|uniref:uncharacterized protein C12orf40 homolog isoform X3 n=1 Tax=Podarcis raffonei TaxID=65483 RepID=UPI0023290F7E|nr:uncharacterized protein C12orf40 homolog isoform X3 [Podarcis raffonei]
MNWVGGSRKRIMLSKEKRKQKDFFEKEKLKSKMKLLGISPLKSSAVSLDLLNLCVVNQISTKKDCSENVRKAVHVDINRGVKFPLRRHNVELPESPQHRQSKPYQDDTEHRIQQEVLENRRKYLSEKQNIQSQPANTVCEEPWFSKAACRRRNFSNPDVDTASGLYFQQLNSPDYSNPLGKSPKVSDDTNFRSHRNEEPLFGFVNNILEATAGESSRPIAAFFEEEKQQFPTAPSSDSSHSFGNKSIIDQLFTDSANANEISRMPSPYDMEEMHQMSSCAHRCPAERDLRGIFTAPEQILFPNSQSLNASTQESINQPRDYCIQERKPVMFSEQQENAKNFGNTVGFESQKRNIKVADSMQNCLEKSRKAGWAEHNLSNLQIFGLEQEACSYYDQHSKHGKQKDEESQLSNQSPSYSPNRTESYATTTSAESEEEEQDGRALSSFENSFARNDGNPLPVSGNQKLQCSCQSVAMYSIFLDKKTTDIHPQAKPARPLKEDMLRRAQTHRSCEKKHANFKAQLNAWSQTETRAEEIEKSDAAVQCNIMQACSCNNVPSSVHSAEITTSASKTTGGQNIPADES